MYNVTLSQLRTLAQQRCHMENSQVIPTAEWNQNINDSGTELHQLLAQAFGAKYSMKSAQFSLRASVDTYPLFLTWTFGLANFQFVVGDTITGGTSGATAIIRSVTQTALAPITGTLTLSDVTGTFLAGEAISSPTSSAQLGVSNGGIGASDFMLLQGIDILIGGNRWLPIPEFNMSERGFFQLPGYNLGAGGPSFAYRFQGNNMVFAPVPGGAYTMRMYYTPTWTALINDSDVVDVVDGWHEIIVLDCCIKAMLKQDLPVDGFMMQKQAMIQRINALKQQRNASAPPRILDTAGDADGDLPGASGRLFGW